METQTPIQELEYFLLNVVSPFDETFPGGDKLYIRNNVLSAMKWAYNLALDKAAKNACIRTDIVKNDEGTSYIEKSFVNKESITSLKLK